jgi:hypothetical protein
MPFIFALFGILFLVVAIQGTQGTMFALLKSEFVGTKSFIPWVSAILILGALGYVSKAKPVTDAMIGLILLVMLLANKGGFFSALNKGIVSPASPVIPSTAPAASNADSGSSSTNAAPSQAITGINPFPAGSSESNAYNASPPTTPANESFPLQSFLKSIFGSTPAY